MREPQKNPIMYINDGMLTMYHMYIHMYIHIYMYIHICIHIYVCTYIQTYKYTYIYIHIHTIEASISAVCPPLLSLPFKPVTPDDDDDDDGYLIKFTTCGLQIHNLSPYRPAKKA
jgi:hypothetical protein